MKKNILTFLSYLLVSALSTAITLGMVSLKMGGFSKLDQLENIIDSFYVGEADVVAMEDAAAAAMIKATNDRWSYYIPAKNYAAHAENSKNAYASLGITITAAQDGSGLQVVAVNTGSSAEAAGIQVDDVIIEIEGQSAADMTLADIRNLIRGEEGTKLKLTIRRAGKTMTIPVKRQEIKKAVAVGQLLEGNVGLISILNFGDRCASETITVIEDLMSQGAEYLIFDVRNNRGGYVNELVDLLDYLLPEGDLLRTVDYAGKEEIDRSDKNCLDMPMAVLVNPKSYSAAEFFAAALQEYDAAIVVGERTVGKGRFQSQFRLKDGSAVSLSIGQYFTPKGNYLEGVGITPDVEVIMSESDASDLASGCLDPMKDMQVLAAMEALQ